MPRKQAIVFVAGVLLFLRTAMPFPFTWDPYLRYLNVQVSEVEVGDGETYWRVAEGYAVPPPDEGFGDIKIWYQAKDETGNPLGGIPVRVFATSSGVTLQNGSTPGEFVMGGGNWLDFYNEPGPYSLEVSAGQPSEACIGLGLPANQHFCYTIVFQRATKGVTPTAPQPTPLGKPQGPNLLANPGAETGELSGWFHSGIQLDGDIFNNCGNRAGQHRFSWQIYGPGSGYLSQLVTVTPGKQYTFGFWVSKKSDQPQLSMTVTWSDNNGGSGTLYTMPAGETIYPVYGTRQDATIEPLGTSLTVSLSMSYGGVEHAAFHLDEFWLVEVIPPGPEYPGDMDGDIDVDQSDFGLFQACLTGEGAPQVELACANARLDGDTDVDRYDLDIFVQCTTGANVPADPDCATGP